MAVNADTAYKNTRVVLGREPTAQELEMAKTSSDKSFTGYLSTQQRVSPEQHAGFFDSLGFGNDINAINSERDTLLKQYGLSGDDSGLGADLKGYLNAYQNNVLAPEVKNSGQIKQELAPDMAKPTPINYLDEFNKAREQYGVDGLEGQMNQLKAEQDQILAERRLRTQGEESKPVPVGVIAGRVSEIDRQENEKLDSVQRAITRVTDQLNTSYKTIDMIMNFTKMTYQDAQVAYTDEWNRNMSIYGLQQDSQQQLRDYQESGIEFAQTERTAQRDEARYQQEIAIQEANSQRQLASANLQTYVNLITTGGINPATMSPDQKTQLAKLSVQSGLPADFLESIQINPQDKMLFSNPDTGQVVFMDANGSVRVQDIPGYRIPPKGSTEADTSVEDYNKAFDYAISEGIDQLKSGEPWGVVWERIHQNFEDEPNSVIDARLGGSVTFNEKGEPTAQTGWAQGDSYENWKRKTEEI